MANLTVSFTGLQLQVARWFYGQEPSVPLSAGSPLTQGQINQINDIIQRGMQKVYQAWKWSFLRQHASIVTNAPFNAGTITVNGGTVTLTAPADWAAGTAYTKGQFIYPSLHNSSNHYYQCAQSGTSGTAGQEQNPWPTNGTVFVDYTGSALQWVDMGVYGFPTFQPGQSIQILGINYPVTATSTTTCTILNATTLLITSGVAFNFVQLLYSMPTVVGTNNTNYFDEIEGPLTYPMGNGYARERVQLIREVEIRKHFTHNGIPAPPRYCAIFAGQFDTTTGGVTGAGAGATRQMMFYPVPDQQYTLTGMFTLRCPQLDATNLYPIGAEVMAEAIQYGVLSQAELELWQRQDIYEPQYERALAAAIQRDREYGTPDTLGKGMCPEEPDNMDRFFLPATINIIAGTYGPDSPPP